MKDNLVQIKSKRRQQGINISFTIEHGLTKEETIEAQIYIERFHAEVQKIRMEQFSRLNATVTSRQEYLP